MNGLYFQYEELWVESTIRKDECMDVNEYEGKFT